MSEAIIASIITGLISLAGTVATIIQTGRKQTALMEYRLKTLEAKQDKHNQTIERTYKLEEAVSLLQAEDKRHNERLKELEAKT